MAYDGAEFCGWQIQPQEPSVQEALERALETLLKVKTGVTGAGRTDTSVSASFYVAHFDFDGPVPAPLTAASDSLDCKQLRFKLNAILPKSVSIISITPADPEFHARFDAKKRQYTYFLHRIKDPFCERYSYLYAYPEVDFEAMNRAAQSLLGTHDFSSFEKSGGDNKTSVCTVFSARWEPYEPVIRTAPSGFKADSQDGEPFSPVPSGSEAVFPDGVPHYWRFTIEADRFLRNMVRAIVGTLLEVGRGRRTIEDFSALVLPPDVPASNASRRSDAGESVPGQALFLSNIDY